jgi:hypothetical protein
MFLYNLNHELVCAAAGWLAAQLIKCIVQLVVNHTLPVHVILGSGGMPSSHSATVCALTTAVGVDCGISSPLFGVCCILAFIVMYDATGVRRETGQQGKVLNDMLQIFEDMGKPISPERKLKELVGHTPLQVFCGGLLGIAIGLLIMLH